LELPLGSQQILCKSGGATNHTEICIPMARTSTLYDSLNGVVLDAILAPYASDNTKCDERSLAIQHLKQLQTHFLQEELEKTLVIFDRGYPSAPLITYMLKHNIPFLMRVNSKFMKEVDQAVSSGNRDSIITFLVKRAVEAKKLLKSSSQI
jgi:hypothetical protein